MTPVAASGLGEFVIKQLVQIHPVFVSVSIFGSTGMLLHVY